MHIDLYGHRSNSGTKKTQLDRIACYMVSMQIGYMIPSSALIW